MFVYHLLCRESENKPIKHYVGKTNNLNRRYEEHRSGQGSSWTQVYKPFDIKFLAEDFDGMEEDRQVKILMKRYGIDNVRGGSYSSFHLTKAQESCLLTEMRSITDKCFNCGSTKHFARDCIMAPKNTATNPEIKTKASKAKGVRRCGICHKTGHDRRTCPNG